MKSCPKSPNCSKYTALPSRAVAVSANQPRCIRRSYRLTTIDSSWRMHRFRKDLRHKDWGLRIWVRSRKIMEASFIPRRGNQQMGLLKMTRTIKTIRWTGTSIQLTTTNWSSMQAPLTAPLPIRITSPATLLSWVLRTGEDNSPLERWKWKPSRRCP